MANYLSPCALAILLPLALAFSPISHAKPTYQPAMTGETLVRDYVGPSGQGHAFLAGNAYVDRETARGYMDGIKDATHGVAWCVHGEAPHELNDDIVAEISKLKLQDRRGNAAPLVVSVLRNRFPCPPKRSAP